MTSRGQLRKSTKMDNMIHLHAVVVLLLVVLGTSAAPFKGENSETDNRISAMTAGLKPDRDDMGREHHKHKQTHKDFSSFHNEVELSQKEKNHLAVTKKIKEDKGNTIVMATQKPKQQNERALLSDWIRSIPRDMFNMKNRMRLASLFLEADSKDDVIDKLARAGGNTRAHHMRRRVSRRRRVRKRWPVPYHPNVRFSGGKRRVKT